MNTNQEIELSIVLPCLNEELTLGVCIEKALGFLKSHNVSGEVVIADNGSTDKSVEIAEKLGAVVAHIPEKGYGSALRGGFAAARGKYIIMADADDSYDLEHLMPFVEKLREGYELVMGNRFKGGIKKGAMPWHHRYIGNPVLSFIGKLFFKTPANDFHCGLRGFTKDAVQRMDLQTTGMELASEIVIKASLFEMKTCEVPTTLSPDGRDRPPHLRSFRDGWRHLRFLMIYSPKWVFLYPGLALTLLSAAASVALFFGPVDIGVRFFDFHSFILAGAGLMIGINLLAFAAITGVFAYSSNLLPKRPSFYPLFQYFTLETGLAIGFLLALGGLGIIAYAAYLSSALGFLSIGFEKSVRLVFGGALLTVTGAQIIFSSFVLSMLGLPPQKR
jgi:glycosyltransferase involved in cell wall biosynthesis